MPRSRLTGTTAIPPATRRGRWSDAPSARAASLASSAALPRPPGDPAHPVELGGGDPYVIPYVNPYVIPYAREVRTPGFGGWGCLSSSEAPRGASQPRFLRLTGPPRGSGAAAPQGALRAIDPCDAAAILADRRSAPPTAAIPADLAATQGAVVAYTVVLPGNPAQLAVALPNGILTGMLGDTGLRCYATQALPCRLLDRYDPSVIAYWNPGVELTSAPLRQVLVMRRQAGRNDSVAPIRQHCRYSGCRGPGS